MMLWCKIIVKQKAVFETPTRKFLYAAAVPGRWHIQYTHN